MPERTRSDDLVAAIKAGDADVVRALLADDVLSEWEYGDTPLSLAAEAGQVGIVRLLLDAGMPVDAEDDDDEGGPGGGRTALTAAAGADAITVAKLLIERGADVNHQSLPLAEAASSLEMTRLLVEAGADPDQDDEEGRPVIIYAVDAGMPEVVEFLAQAAGWERDESFEELLRTARDVADNRAGGFLRHGTATSPAGGRSRNGKPPARYIVGGLTGMNPFVIPWRRPRRKRRYPGRW